MAVTAKEIAWLAVQEAESGWIKSRSGNYYLETENGNLSVCFRDRHGWGWNFYETDFMGSVAKFPRFQGAHSTPLGAMLEARLWKEDEYKSQ